MGHRKNNKEYKTIDGKVYKKCTEHKNYFPDEDSFILMDEEHFYLNNCNKEDGYFPYCKRCNIKKYALWVKDNPEKRKVVQDKYNRTYKRNLHNRDIAKKRRDAGIQKDWQDNNPDKLREYNEKRKIKAHEISATEWKACRKYFNYSCAYCGMTEEEHKKLYRQSLHKEHVDPNGGNGLENCVPSCKRCNCSKHWSNLIEWYKKQPFYDEEKLNKVIQWLDKDYLVYKE